MPRRRARTLASHRDLRQADDGLAPQIVPRFGTMEAVRGEGLLGPYPDPWGLNPRYPSTFCGFSLTEDSRSLGSEVQRAQLNRALDRWVCSHQLKKSVVPTLGARDRSSGTLFTRSEGTAILPTPS